MSGRTIELVIDEILVHGVTALDPDRFRAQVERELGRILQQEGGLPALVEPTGLCAVAPAQTLTVAPGQAPSALQVARAVHGSIMKTMEQDRQPVGGPTVVDSGGNGSAPPLQERHP